MGAARSVTLSRNVGAFGSQGSSWLTSTSARFVRQSPRISQHRQSNVGLVRIEPSGVFVPLQVAVGQREHQVVRPTVLQPVGDILINPVGGNRLFRTPDMGRGWWAVPSR